MKKNEIINLWIQKYNLDSRTINQVLEFVFDLSKEKIFLLEETNPIFYEKIISIFEKLDSWYPLAYITKKVNFMWFDFYIDENVLIPRDDTEILVREVICHCESNEAIQKIKIKWRFPTSREWQSLLDIWTGSGIIPITIAKNTKIVNIFAIDISINALEIAKRNILQHNLQDKIKILNADFRKFDYTKFTWKNLIITANLPYIKENDFENMDFWVYNFEPKIALYGGKETWFELYEDLINLLIKERSMFNNLVLFIEIWFDQFEVSKKFLSKKWLKFEFFKDTNNIYRVIKIIL
jgi:release factor glutamine methyltransferase